VECSDWVNFFGLVQRQQTSVVREADCGGGNINRAWSEEEMGKVSEVSEHTLQKIAV